MRTGRRGLPASHRPLGAIAVAVAFGLLLSTGCASLPDLSLHGFAADYDTAEARARATDRELLILYRDTRPGAAGSSRLAGDRMFKSLSHGELKRTARQFVACTLFRSFEPDRRYVAQYGVERAPALIVVHRDGTYHSHAGQMSADDIARFLAGSTPPGAAPTINPYIPRRTKYDWHSSLESALAVAGGAGQPVLVVFHRRMTRDWTRIKKLMECREVHTRLADMTHCRIGTYPPWAKTQSTRFGRLKLPAIVVADGEERYEVLELPTSSEAVIRFADRARIQTRGSGTASAAELSGGPVSPSGGQTEGP